MNKIKLIRLTSFIFSSILAIDGDKNKILTINDLQSISSSLGAISGAFSKAPDKYVWVEYLTLLEDSGEILTIAITPDNKRIIAGSTDKTVKILDFYGNIRKILKLNTAIKAMALTSDGKYIVSGDIGNLIKIWDIDTYAPLKYFLFHFDQLAITSDSKYIILSSYDTPITIIEFSSTKIEKTISGSKASAMALTPNNINIVSNSEIVGEPNLVLWDFATGQMLQKIKSPDEVMMLAITHDGKKIISGAFDGKIKVWDLKFNLLKSLTGHTMPISSIAITPDDKQIVSGSTDGTIKIWDLSAGTVIQTLTGHTGGVNAIAITSDGKYIVSGSNDQTIKLWKKEIKK